MNTCGFLPGGSRVSDCLSACQCVQYRFEVYTDGDTYSNLTS